MSLFRHNPEIKLQATLEQFYTSEAAIATERAESMKQDALDKYEEELEEITEKYNQAREQLRMEHDYATAHPTTALLKYFQPLDVSSTSITLGLDVSHRVCTVKITSKCRQPTVTFYPRYQYFTALNLTGRGLLEQYLWECGTTPKKDPILIQDLAKMLLFISFTVEELREVCTCTDPDTIGYCVALELEKLWGKKNGDMAKRKSNVSDDEASASNSAIDLAAEGVVDDAKLNAKKIKV